MAVHDEDPAKALLAELGGEVHEDAAQRGRTYRIGSGEAVLAADLVGAARPERDGREHHDRPARPRDDGLREIAGQALVDVSVGVGGQIGAVLLEDAARNDHRRPRPIQRADLVGVHLAQVAHLPGRGRDRGPGRHGQDRDHRAHGSTSGAESNSRASAANIRGLSLLGILYLFSTAAAASPSPVAEERRAPAILVSRQLLASEHLAVGDVVTLSADPKGARPREFRIAGVYEPVPDPARLGAAPLEARLHLPDLMDLTADPADPVASDSVRSINVKLAEASDAAAFARELAARAPGILVRDLAAPDDSDVTFVVLDRFHLAISLVTVIASSIFLLALMVMLVDERRDTVAILRLIGLRRRRIFIQVLAEGLVIALAGALFG